MLNLLLLLVGFFFILLSRSATSLPGIDLRVVSCPCCLPLEALIDAERDVLFLVPIDSHLGRLGALKQGISHRNASVGNRLENHGAHGRTHSSRPWGILAVLYRLVTSGFTAHPVAHGTASWDNVSRSGDGRLH